MTQPNKNYLGIGLVGFAIIVFWIFGVTIWDRISLLDGAIEEREALMLSREEVFKKIEVLAKQYQERINDVKKISTIVPETKSSAELVSTVEAISQQSGLQLIEIATGNASHTQKEPQTIFIELGLIGNYPSLVVFLDLLEKNIRLIDVYEVNASQTALLGGQTKLNFRIKANAYYLNSK